MDESETQRLINNMYKLRDKLLYTIRFFKRVIYGMIILTWVNMIILLFIVLRNI